MAAGLLMQIMNSAKKHFLKNKNVENTILNSKQSRDILLGKIKDIEPLKLEMLSVTIENDAKLKDLVEPYIKLEQFHFDTEVFNQGFFVNIPEFNALSSGFKLQLLDF